MPACPHCGAAVQGDPFCAGCGKQLAETDAEYWARQRRRSALDKVDRARLWLIVAGALICLGGAWQYFKAGARIDARTEQIESSLLTPEQRDQAFRSPSGLDYKEAIAQERARQRLALIVALGLAALFFALSWWAGRAPLAAAVTALFLYATLIVLNAAADPATLFQNAIVKAGLVAALLSAVVSVVKTRQAKPVA